MLILLQKMGTLVFLLALGYLCARLKIVDKGFNRGLSKLVINVFLVGMILSSVINKELNMTGADALKGFLMLLAMMLMCYGIGMLTPRTLGIKDGDRGMYKLLVAFMNNGFMGFPLVAAIYGDQWVFFASLSNIPFNLMLYSIGVTNLADNEERAKLSIKSIINTPLIATLIAVVIFIISPEVPAIIDDTIDTVGAATVPLSMMCIGLSLGDVPLKDSFIKPRLYLLSFVRLIICPLAVWLVLHFFSVEPTILGICVVLSACPSAVICSILGMQYGRDGIEASEAIFLSTVLSVVTMPLLVYALGL